MGGGCGRVAHVIADHFAEEHDVLLIRPADETRMDVNGHLRTLGMQSAGEGNASVPVMNRRSLNQMFDTLDFGTPDVLKFLNGSMSATN